MHILEIFGLKNVPSKDKIFNLISILLILFALVYTLVMYNVLPEEIPTHFGADGKADKYGSKSTFLILVGITLAISLSLLVLSNYPHLFNYGVKITDENRDKQFELAVSMMRQLNAFVTACMVYIILVTSLMACEIIHFSGLGFLFLFVLLAGIAWIIGTYVIKSNKEK